jgi:predicted nucleic acid-binding protein
LCVHEAATQQTRSLLEKFAPVVWWGSLVEVHGAICRLHRDKDISGVEKLAAVNRLRVLTRQWKEITPTETLRDLAIRSLDNYLLRAADCLQLAASLTWCHERPSRRNFISGDRRLAQAAASVGFSVIEL